MTSFGIDVSHYQDVNLANLAKQGFDFFASKVTEGAHTADASYAGNLQEAKAAQALFCAYHFLRSDSSPEAQAQNCASHLIDKSVPVMIDLEPSGSSKPTLHQASLFRAALNNLGVRATILYFPHFWWVDQGSPSLSGWAVWQARYPSAQHQFASVLYAQGGGDHGSGWSAQGGSVPVIWQFASSAKITGYSGSVDVNAFAGTRAELAATSIFKDFAPHPVTPAKPAKPPVAKPVKPNRITKFRAETQKLVATYLDPAIASGRKGAVRDARAEILATLDKTLPKR